MVKTLGNFAKFAKNSLSNEDPFFWLYEIDLPATADEEFQQLRLTNSNRQIEYGQDDNGDALIWSPAPIGVGGVRSSAEGDLPVIQVNVGSTRYEFASAIDKRDGLIGAAATIYLVQIRELGSFGSGFVYPGEVSSLSLNHKGVTVEISAQNLYRGQFPRDVYRRRKCSRVFGGPGCGYPIGNTAASFSECPGTLPACIARGDDEVAIGQPRRHPQNFRAFLGIPRRP